WATVMASGRGAAGFKRFHLAEPFAPVACDHLHEVVEEQILALHAAQHEDRAERIHLARDPAGMMLAEIERFLERERRVERQRALVQPPVKRAAIDRLADDVHAAAALDERAALGMAERIGLLEVAQCGGGGGVRAVVYNESDLLPVWDPVVLGK